MRGRGRPVWPGLVCPGLGAVCGPCHRPCLDRLLLLGKKKKDYKIKMQQRKSASDRPLGTDGSDFSYRMVVDQRYKKVADGKSRLRKLLLVQTIIQILGVISMFLFTTQEKGPSSLSILSVAIGFISLIIGGLGRTRSLVTLLRLYSTASSMAVALSVACVVQNHSQVIQGWDTSSIKGYELLEVGCTTLGVLLQIIIIITTIGLVQNMSPKRNS